MPQEIREDDRIEFIPKQCPTCKQWMCIRHLGVWGYYCIDCMMWWGTYEPWPKLHAGKKPSKTEDAPAKKQTGKKR